MKKATGLNGVTLALWTVKYRTTRAMNTERPYERQTGQFSLWASIQSFFLEDGVYAGAETECVHNHRGTILYGYVMNADH